MADPLDEIRRLTRFDDPPAAADKRGGKTGHRATARPGQPMAAARTRLWPLLITLAAVCLLWGTPLVYPLRLLVVFFVIGGMLALLVRAELAKPGVQYVDPQTYNGLFSVHASLMIFLFVIPAFAGLANFVVPLMLGAADMAFPRLNALSFWLLPIAGLMMLSSFVVPGGAFACGWTGYAPLCSTHQPLGAIATLGLVIVFGHNLSDPYSRA